MSFKYNEILKDNYDHWPAIIGILTNSLKHAYKPGEAGKTEVSFIKDNENNYVFSVKDYGVGIPDTVDFQWNNKTL